MTAGDTDNGSTIIRHLSIPSPVERKEGSKLPYTAN